MLNRIVKIGKPIQAEPYVTQAQLTTTIANLRNEIDLLGSQVDIMRQEVARMKREHEENKQVETPEPAKKPARRTRKAKSNGTE